MNICNLMATFRHEDSCILRLSDGLTELLVSIVEVHKSDAWDNAHLVHDWIFHECKSTFSVTAQAMLHKSRVPLKNWFMAMSIFSIAKKTDSSCQLIGKLDLNQETSQYLALRIREKMMEGDDSLLNGIVEVDYTYVGGKVRGGDNKRGRGTKKTKMDGF